MTNRKNTGYLETLRNIANEKPSQGSTIILWVVVAISIVLLLWANIAQVDEIARGEGRVIPSKRTQIIQNLDGGVVSQILVQEGQEVKEGELLLRMNPEDSQSTYNENNLRHLELKARAVRLQPEVSESKMTIPYDASGKYLQALKEEKALNDINVRRLTQKISILQEEEKQAQISLDETYGNKRKFENSLKLLNKKIELTRPLVLKNIVPTIELIDLEREQNELKGEIETADLEISKLKSIVFASKEKIKEARLEFSSTAQEEYTKVSSEIQRLKESSQVLENRVSRTEIKSPVNGIIKSMAIKTIGGVIKPGMDILEIVPIDDVLYIETKIKPSDIAYIFPGQKANVKFTAYDFTIFGGLSGVVADVSPDTIKDDKGNSFYIVKIKTNKSYLTKGKKNFEILVGMVAQVDIITGKKDVIDYLLKPILKTNEYALTER